MPSVHSLIVRDGEGGGVRHSLGLETLSSTLFGA